MNRYYIYSFILGGCITALLMQRFMQPEKEVRTEVQEKEKIVYREHTTVSPDGTKTTDIERTERRNTQVEQVLRESPYKPGYRVGIAYDTRRAYTATIERRLAGPIFVGASYKTDGTLSAGIAIEF